jgi:hypothetical protein
MPTLLDCDGFRIIRTSSSIYTVAPTFIQLTISDKCRIEIIRRLHLGEEKWFSLQISRGIRRQDPNASPRWHSPKSYGNDVHRSPVERLSIPLFPYHGCGQRLFLLDRNRNPSRKSRHAVWRTQPDRPVWFVKDYGRRCKTDCSNKTHVAKAIDC